MRESESDVAQMEHEAQADTPRSGTASRWEDAEQRTLQAQRDARNAELDEAERQARIQGNETLKNAHKRICAIVSRFGTGLKCDSACLESVFALGS